MSLSSVIGLLSWTSYNFDLVKDKNLLWYEELLLILMTYGPIMLGAFMIALVVGIITYKTNLKKWWYPDSRASGIVVKLSIIGLIFISCTQVTAAADLREIRFALHLICICGLFVGLMGFSKKYFEINNT